MNIWLANWTFKENRNILIPPLLFIINLSLDSGIFPESQKIAKVIPVYKKGYSLIPNYRPISLLPSLEIFFRKDSLQPTNFVSK